MKAKVKSLKDAFLSQYPKNGKVLDIYEKANEHSATWSNLSKLSLTNFVEYLSETVAQSSAKTYCAMFKSVLNRYNEEVELPKDYARVLTVKNEISQQTYLGEDEIQKLIAYSPQSERELYVRNMFVVSCLTGCRHSDAVKLTKSNIVDGKLVYVSKKTHIKSEVPLAPFVEKVLCGDVEVCSLPTNQSSKENAVRATKKAQSGEESTQVGGGSGEDCANVGGGNFSEGILPFFSEGTFPNFSERMFPDFSETKFTQMADNTYNNTLRAICRNCGITDNIKLYQAGEEQEGEKYLFISSHTARRSYATNLYLKTRDIFLISKLMGHSGVDMTCRYIVSAGDVPQEVKDYINQFK